MIFLSIGHHASKPGAVFEGFAEFDEASVWVPIIHNYIGAERCKIVPVGTLQSKVDYINSRVTTDSVAIEIHFNSAKSWKDLNKDGVATENEMKNEGRGSETLFFPGSKLGAKLATDIQNKLGQVFDPDRGIKEGWYRMQKQFGADYFLEKTKCTSVIVEPEFIHRKDIIIKKRGLGAIAIAQGLLEYCALTNYCSGGTHEG